MRAAEFFAGIGLMRMGLDREGWTTVWSNDLDEKKKAYHHFITKS
jgi:DNA (cytosine-5)-methyltransferase 1